MLLLQVRVAVGTSNVFVDAQDQLGLVYEFGIRHRCALHLWQVTSRQEVFVEGLIIARSFARILMLSRLGVPADHISNLLLLKPA